MQSMCTASQTVGKILLCANDSTNNSILLSLSRAEAYAEKSEYERLTAVAGFISSSFPQT